MPERQPPAATLRSLPSTETFDAAWYKQALQDLLRLATDDNCWETAYVRSIARRALEFKAYNPDSTSGDYSA